MTHTLTAINAQLCKPIHELDLCVTHHSAHIHATHAVDALYSHLLIGAVQCNIRNAIHLVYGNESVGVGSGIVVVGDDSVGNLPL